MYLQEKQIIGLPVKTQSGLMLGKVKHFTINTETGELAQLEIGSSSLAKLFAQSLLINKSQIITISQQEIIVADGVSDALARNKAGSQAVAKEEAAPALNQQR